ncbi:MAG: stage 0 sporulation family protein [Nitrospirae bacterium]|nr:stage 0 sporulation family protein [Nitrospirota bacterium]
MSKIIQVRLRESGKILSFHAQEFNLKAGEKVIVEGDRGEAFGEVISPQSFALREDRRGKPIKKIRRIASPEDNKRLKENKVKEAEALQACLKKIEEREMPMKLVDAEYSFDRSRITFYFTAEERVDFRELVKDLAHLFKARIEMRQIGVRDEARRLGGYGCCGRSLCCATFLKEFEPVTIRMAKEQRLSLDPSKVSGTCGRLLCCLTYECKTYREMGKKLPKERTKVVTEQGEGEIVDLNILKQTVTVKLSEGQKIEVPVEKITRSRPQKKKKESTPARRQEPKSRPK